MADSNPERAALDDLHAPVKPLLTWKSPVLGAVAFLFVTLPSIHGWLAAWIAAHTRNQIEANLWVAIGYLIFWGIFLFVALIWDAVVRRRFAAEQARLRQAQQEGATQAYKDVHEKLGATRGTVMAASYAMLASEDLEYFYRSVKPLAGHIKIALIDAVRAGSVQHFDNQLRHLWGQAQFLEHQYRALALAEQMAADPREVQNAVADWPMLEGLQPEELKTLAQRDVVRLERLSRMIELIERLLNERYKACLAALRTDDPARALQAFRQLR